MTKNKDLPIVTVVLASLNVLGFILQIFLGSGRLIYQFGMYEGALRDGELARAVVSAFLHGGFPHLLSNMACLLLFGFSLEKKISSLRFLIIYLAGMIGSALLIEIAGGEAVHIGASGAIWGLMAAMLVYNLRNHINPLLALRGILINLIYSFSAGVSWQGHIGGGLLGLIASLMLISSPRREGPYPF